MTLNVLWLPSLCFDLCKLGDSERGRIHKSCILKVSFPRADRGTAKLVPSPQAEDRHLGQVTGHTPALLSAQSISAIASEMQMHSERLHLDYSRLLAGNILLYVCKEQHSLQRKVVN